MAFIAILGGYGVEVVDVSFARGFIAGMAAIACYVIGVNENVVLADREHGEEVE